MSDQRVIPALRVKSYAASKSFYDKLGFTEQWTHQFADGMPVFASIIRDGMEIYLTEHRGDCERGGLVHFYVEDVDGLYEELVSGGVSIPNPPANNIGPDLRDMRIKDPDGNRLAFLTRSDPT